jgi:hypothetical protein
MMARMTTLPGRCLMVSIRVTAPPSCCQVRPVRADDSDIDYTVFEACTMWLPNWLYHSLPFIYAAIGMLAIYLSDRPTVRGPGLLLVLIAFIILKMRWDYRSANKHLHTRKRQSY